MDKIREYAPLTAIEPYFFEGDILELAKKLQNYSSLKTLDDLKEMLCRNKNNEKDITSINWQSRYDW